MKRLFLVIFLALFTTQLIYAQCNAFYPLKSGVRYEYDYIDNKEKVATRSINMFKDISGSGNNMKATLVQELIDAKKNKSIGTSESEWVCENGVLHFTVNSMNFMMDSNPQAKSPDMKVEVLGDKMDLPSDLKVGQTMRDITYQIKMTLSGMSLMNKTYKVRDRKVEAEESVTTPAGTFTCYKITFTSTSEGGIGNGTIKSVMWYAKDVGLVKSENYKEDGKFLGRQILTKISK
jgi:hypothetical protein